MLKYHVNPHTHTHVQAHTEICPKLNNGWHLIHIHTDIHSLNRQSSYLFHLDVLLAHKHTLVCTQTHPPPHIPQEVMSCFSPEV